MGEGDKELSLKLINNYLKLIHEDNRLPKIMTFYNAGVKLLHNHSTVLEALISIEKAGVKLVACKTCLDFYDITNQLGVGTPGTMHDIITLQSNADKVINL